MTHGNCEPRSCRLPSDACLGALPKGRSHPHIAGFPLPSNLSPHATARLRRPRAPAGPDLPVRRAELRALRASRAAGDLEQLFHPAVAAWFAKTFPAPTPAQVEAWRAIKAGRPTLIAAPTGSGKTLAAFLAAIDDLVRQGLEGALTDETHVVYVSPLKALSNDIRINLDAPLEGVRAELARLGLPDVAITAWVRTGDTTSSERQKCAGGSPHILVTTPESLYVLLGSESGRKMLASTRSVIVDEIHAVAPNKRGAHLALSLERLAALCGDRLQRIGLSATQNPIDAVANFLTGGAGEQTAVIDAGHHRRAISSSKFPARRSKL